MSLFPRFPSSELGPLFRLIDDYTSQNPSGSSTSSSIRAFHPKFDVREHKDSYELQGELPGLEQKDIHIEFADPHTLVIKGRVEREYSSDDSQAARGRITGEVTDHTRHKASVEDEGAEGSSTPGKGGETSKASDNGEGQKKDGTKYWVSERSVGEFYRAFSFPSRVDQDAVKANLKNGILSVVIPKAVSHHAKRIMVEWARFRRLRQACDLKHTSRYCLGMSACRWYHELLERRLYGLAEVYFAGEVGRNVILYQGCIRCCWWIRLTGWEKSPPLKDVFDLFGMLGACTVASICSEVTFANLGFCNQSDMMSKDILLESFVISEIIIFIPVAT